MEKLSYCQKIIDGPRVIKHSPPSLLRRWFTFSLSLLGMWLFIFVIAPFFEQSDYVRPMVRYVEESGIDAGAIYYTEVAEVSQADLMIRDTFRFYLAEK